MTRKPDNAAPTECSFEVLNPGGSFPGLIVCDHASSEVPAEYRNLGLGEEDLDKHIGIDIGIADVVRTLCQRLDATAVLTRYSRLLLDCNRWIEDPRLILAESDGILVPGNSDVTEAEKAQRAEAYFWPYHGAVSEALANLVVREQHPFIVSLHSCTRRLGQELRPWDAGTIWHESNVLSDALIAALAQRGDLKLGDNQPYSGIGGTFTIDYHSWSTGIPACGLEVTNDLLSTPEGRSEWSDRLTDALGDLASARASIWNKHNGIERASSPRHLSAS